MTISEGDRLPAATLTTMGANGPEAVDLAARIKGRKVVIFAVPGAFTPTCSTAHVPSFIRTKAALAAKGVEEVICVAVNDPFVMAAWGGVTGATAAGITMLSDAESILTTAMGLDFTATPTGLIKRSQRYAMMVEDGVVKVFHKEISRGCEISGGEAMVAAL